MSCFLEFDRAGRISGIGDDEVGPFSIAGEYNTNGNVEWTKSYHTHTVHYNGTLSAQNLQVCINGFWQIKAKGDEFMIVCVNAHRV